MRLHGRDHAPENRRKIPRVNVSNGEARPNEATACTPVAPRIAANYEGPLGEDPASSRLIKS